MIPEHIMDVGYRLIPMQKMVGEKWEWQMIVYWYVNKVCGGDRVTS